MRIRLAVDKHYSLFLASLSDKDRGFFRTLASGSLAFSMKLIQIQSNAVTYYFSWPASFGRKPFGRQTFDRPRMNWDLLQNNISCKACGLAIVMLASRCTGQRCLARMSFGKVSVGTVGQMSFDQKSRNLSLLFITCHFYSGSNDCYRCRVLSLLSPSLA